MRRRWHDRASLIIERIRGAFLAPLASLTVITLTGNDSIVAAGHDLATQAAQLTAAQGLALSAGHDVTVGAGEQTHTSAHSEAHTRSSLFNTGATRFGSLDPESYSRASQSSTARIMGLLELP